jgi:hypothetical protein
LKKEIRIDITGAAATGKTTILYLIKHALEQAGLDVDIDPMSQTMLESNGHGYRPEQVHQAIDVLKTRRPIIILNDQHAIRPRSEPAVDAELDDFLSKVRAEVIRARQLFPGDRIMTLALAEEFGELVKATLDEPAANVRKEAVQTAAMAARVVLDGDSSVKEWRANKGLDQLVPEPTVDSRERIVCDAWFEHDLEDGWYALQTPIDSIRGSWFQLEQHAIKNNFDIRWVGDRHYKPNHPFVD